MPLESAAEYHWNGWPNAIGISGRMWPEYALSLQLQQVDNGGEVILDPVMHFAQQHLLLVQRHSQCCLGPLAFGNVRDDRETTDDLGLGVVQRGASDLGQPTPAARQMNLQFQRGGITRRSMTARWRGNSSAWSSRP